MRANLLRRQFMARFVCAALPGFGAIALAGCGTGGAPARTRGEVADVAPSVYRLGAGDELRIIVFGEAELSGQFIVSPTGSIAYPLLGEVDAGGKTVLEFSAALAERLRGGYVREPNVNVEVTNYRPFFILGEVAEPGTFPYTSNLTVMNAVAMANGFSYRADTRRVFIKHAGLMNEREYRLTSTTPVQPGDTVRIPERRF